MLQHVATKHMELDGHSLRHFFAHGHFFVKIKKIRGPTRHAQSEKNEKRAKPPTKPPGRPRSVYYLIARNRRETAINGAKPPKMAENVIFLLVWVSWPPPGRPMVLENARTLLCYPFGGFRKCVALPGAPTGVHGPAKVGHAAAAAIVCPDNGQGRRWCCQTLAT